MSPRSICWDWADDVHDSPLVRPLDLSFSSRDVRLGRTTVTLSCWIRQGGRRTLVFLHGLGGSKNDFLHAIHAPTLRRFTLIAFDLPGCGNSSSFDGPARIEDLVALTARLLEELDQPRVSIAGHSLGGLIGLVFGETYPHLVNCFINVEGNLAPEDCFLTREVARHGPEEFFDLAMMQSIAERLSRSGCRGGRIFADALSRNTTQRAFYEYCAAAVTHSYDGDLMRRFLHLPVPRCFLHGARNSGLSYLPALREAGIPVLPVRKSGHWPMHDEPLEFYAALARALSLCYSDAGSSMSTKS